MSSMTIFHIPVCPFSQRIEIALTLMGRSDAVRFHTVDITVPRPPWLLEKTRGGSAMPVLELADGKIVNESLVILRYLLDRFPDPRLVRSDPWERAVENMLIAREGAFVSTGYRFVMNQDRSARADFENTMLKHYTSIDEFLRQHGSSGPWLFEDFGLAETVFTPFFMRFWFLEYYEGFELPAEPRFDRVRAWRDACLAHPAAAQVTREEIIKVYYDYAKGAGDGALVPGRTRSSFVFDPPWQVRPWPPRDKYDESATDEELGLLGA
jgi:glutathione S-transferase